MEKKFVMVITHATDNPLRASSALTVANAIKAMGSDLVIFLMNEGVLLGKKGVVENINHPNFTTAKQLLSKLQEEGVSFYLCGNCAPAFQVEEKDLIEGAQIAGAATLVEFMQERESISLWFIGDSSRFKMISPLVQGQLGSDKKDATKLSYCAQWAKG